MVSGRMGGERDKDYFSICVRLASSSLRTDLKEVRMPRLEVLGMDAYAHIENDRERIERMSFIGAPDHAHIEWGIKKLTGKKVEFLEGAVFTLQGGLSFSVGMFLADTARVMVTNMPYALFNAPQGYSSALIESQTFPHIYYRPHAVCVFPDRGEDLIGLEERLDALPAPVREVIENRREHVMRFLKGYGITPFYAMRTTDA